MNVMMYWYAKEDFDAWHASNHLKESHKREKADANREKKQSPILKNTVVIDEVVAEWNN